MTCFSAHRRGETINENFSQPTHHTFSSGSVRAQKQPATIGYPCRERGGGENTPVFKDRNEVALPIIDPSSLSQL